MRIVLLSAVAVLALAITGASQPASTATKTVTINRNRVQSPKRHDHTGDAVKGTNATPRTIRWSRTTARRLAHDAPGKPTRTFSARRAPSATRRAPPDPTGG